MPIYPSSVQNLFDIASKKSFPRIHQRLAQIGVENLGKYMTPERYNKVKNAMLYNDPSKALKALALLPNQTTSSPITPKQLGAILKVSRLWFMPESVQHLVSNKDLEKLTKQQGSTVIDRMNRIEEDIQAAEDASTAADPLDVQVVEMILGALPNSENIK